MRRNANAHRTAGIGFRVPQQNLLLPFDRPGPSAAPADMALHPAVLQAVPGTGHSESWASEEDTKDAATMQPSSMSSPRERPTSLLANLSAMLDLGTPRRTSPPHAWSVNAVEYSPVLSPAKPVMEWSNRTHPIGDAPDADARDEPLSPLPTGISPSEAREREKTEQKLRSRIVDLEHEVAAARFAADHRHGSPSSTESGLKQQVHAVEKDNATLKAQNTELWTSNAAMNSQICKLQEELETLQRCDSDAQSELRMLRKISRVPAKCAMCGWESSVRIPTSSQSSRPRETVNTCVYEDVTRGYDFRLGLHVLDKKGSMRVASFTTTSVCKDALQIGDQILSIDGQRVRDARHLRQLCHGDFGTLLSIRYSRMPNEEVFEILLQRSADGQGQPIFTHYVPCTPRAPPPAAHTSRGGGGNSNGLNPGDERGMNVIDNATPALERELIRSLDLLGQVQAELLKSKETEAQTLALLKRAKNDLGDAVKREDAKTREIDELLGKNFELESQIHQLKSQAVGLEEELRRVREELQASTDALEQECGKASEDEEILRSLAADVNLVTNLCPLQTSRKSRCQEQEERGRESMSADSVQHKIVQEQVSAAMKDALERMSRLENERTNMMRVMMMREKAAFEGRLDDAHAEIQRLSADVKSSRQGNASLSCCISHVPSIVPEPQSTRPVFLPLPPSPGGGDHGSVPTSP